MNIRKLLLALLALTSLGARADMILSTPAAQVVSGSAFQLELTITNSESTPLTVDVPSPVHVRFETPSAISIIELTPERSGALTIAPGGFARVKLQGALPAGAEGVATLVPTGLASNSVALQILQPAPGDDTIRSGQFAKTQEPQQAKDSYTTALVD